MPTVAPPSASLAHDTAHAPIASVGRSGQPRRFQPQTTGDQEKTTRIADSSFRATNPLEILQNRTSGSMLLSSVQEEGAFQSVQQLGFFDGKGEQRIMDSPELTTRASIHESDSEIIGSLVGPQDSETTYVTTTTTTTEVQEQTDNKDAEHSATTATATTSSSQTASGQYRRDGRPTSQGTVSRRSSFYHDGRFPRSSESKQYSFTSTSFDGGNTDTTISVFRSVHDTFLQMEHSRRQERDRVEHSRREEVDRAEHSRRDQMDQAGSLLGALREEHERHMLICTVERTRLLEENASFSAQISLLQIKLGSEGRSPSGDQLDHDSLGPIISKVTTTIVTVTTRIEQWKHKVSSNPKGISISAKDLEQLLSDLSETSSQMKELQQQYTELSKYSTSIRAELKLVSSRNNEKDQKIILLTAEVDQLKGTYEALQHDFSGTSSREVELQRHIDAQLLEISSARNMLAEKDRTIASITAERNSAKSTLEERDQTIVFVTAERDRYKQSDIIKGEEMSTLRQKYERVEKDAAAATSRTSDLQTRYDAQFAELISVRKELQAARSLIEERDRKVTTLEAEVEHGKRTVTTKDEQIAAAQGAKEKLQQDLATISSQASSLQQRYDALSKENITIQSELRSHKLLLEEKEHTITSFTAKVSEATSEISAKEEQVLAARKDVERLRGEVSSTSSQIADLRERYNARSKEFDSVHDELQRIKLLYASATDQIPGGLSEDDVAQHIGFALEEKNKQIEKLRGELSKSTSQNTELRNSSESLLGDLTSVRDKLTMTVAQYESTITSLKSQLERSKRLESTQADEVATALERVAKMQEEISTLTSQLADLQRRHETQSGEFVSVREELNASRSSVEKKDRIISSLNAEVDQLKRSYAGKEDQIATTLKQVQELQIKLTTSTSEFAELRGRYEAQSRDLSSMRSDLQAKTSDYENSAHRIDSLTLELEQWKRSDVTKTEQLKTLRNEVEKFELDLSRSTSEYTRLQSEYEAQSHELDSISHELEIRMSSSKNYDSTVAGLVAQIEEWRSKDSSKDKRIVAIREQAEALQLEVTKYSSQITELRERYDAQSKEFGSLRIRFQETTSEVEKLKILQTTTTKALTTTTEDLKQARDNLAEAQSEVGHWKHEEADRRGELTVVRDEIDRLRRDLRTSTTQITEYQQRTVLIKSEIERWKVSDAAKTTELNTTREKLVQLEHNLFISTSQVTEWKERLEKQTTELRSVREQLRVAVSSGNNEQVIAALNAKVEKYIRADADKVEEISRMKGELETLRRRLTSEASAASTQILSEVKNYADIMKLTSMIESWLREDGGKVEELALELTRRKRENEELYRNLTMLREIYIRAPELKVIFQSRTTEIQSYEEKSRKLESQLAERQSQLDGVQRFVTTADTYADTTLVEKLQKLNAEVQQSTTLVADFIMENIHSRDMKPTEERNSAAQRVSYSIGESLTDCLWKEDRDEVSLYLPIAFQAYLSYHLRWIISSWTTDKGYNDHIQGTYEQLQKSEAQTISGRWRSLTRTYISPTCLSDQKALVADTMQGLSEVIVAAGFASSSSSAISNVLSKFEDKLSNIIRTAGEFSKMISAVVSADFEILAATPVDPFEEATMEEDADGYDDSGEPVGQKVLCSTQLGMAKRMQSVEGKKDTLTVMKTKVILESFLDD